MKISVSRLLVVALALASLALAHVRPAAAQSSLPSPAYAGLTVYNAPIFVSCNGYLVGHGSSPVTCASGVPASILTGTAPIAVLPAFAGGDCTSTAGSVALTCAKTAGVAFGYYATGTDASHLTGVIALPRLPNMFGSYTAHGDSITLGAFANPTVGNRYSDLIGTALGVPVTNKGVSGSLAVDRQADIYAELTSTTARQLFTMMFGTNEAAFWGDANRQANYRSVVSAEAAWLALPETNKWRGQSSAITYTGTWSNDATHYGGAFSKMSSTNGSTASASVFGRVAYVAMGAEDGNAGAYSIAIDGVQTFGSYAAVGANNSVMSTPQGTTHGSFLIRIAGLSEGPHTITITVTSSTGTVWLDWIGQPSGALVSGGPAVVIGSSPRLPSNESGVAPFQQIAREVAGMLAGDGLNVSHANVPGYMNVATDFVSDGSHTADNVHPFNVGHAHIAQAFLASLDYSAGARSRSNTPVGTQSEFRGQVLAGSPIVYGVGPGSAALSGGSNGLPNSVCNAGVDNVIVGGGNNVICNGGTPNTNRNFIGAGLSNSISYGGDNVIAGGSSNVVQGFTGAVGGGSYNKTTGNNSAIPGGSQATDRGRYGALVFASGKFTAQGDAQYGRQILRAKVTNSTAVRMTADGAAAGLFNSMPIPMGGIYRLVGNCAAENKVGGDFAGWSAALLANNVGGTVNILSSAFTRDSGSTAGSSGWTLTSAADSANNGSVGISFSGASSNETRAVCVFDSVEITQ